jgi:glycosyltransferase involved in cell wall biosynthesis
MTILQLCLSSSLGGLELYFLETTLYLHNNSNHDVLAMVKSGTLLHEKMIENGINHLVFEKQTGKFPLLSALKMKKQLANQSFQILHIHCKKDLPLAAWLKTFMTGSFKLVHTRQMNMPGNKRSFYHTFQYQKIDKLLTITQKLHADIKNRVNISPSRIETLYYGVKVPSRFDQAAFESWVAQYEKHVTPFRIAIFGNLNATKAQHNIIEALSLIKHDLPENWKLYLVGKFIDENYLVVIQDLLNEKRIYENVVVTGFVDNAKKWMPGFDLIVLTTLGETFGLVLVEAMKSGVAVIGTNSEGVPEIIDHQKTGLLVNPNDIQDLSTSILLLYKDDKMRKSMAKAGLEKANMLFDFDSHYKRLMEVYHEVAS